MKAIIITFSVLAVSILGFFLFIIFSSADVSKKEEILSAKDLENAQILELSARGGYSPTVINATANKPTILRVNTKNTFDCSLSLTIPSINVRKMLPSNGSTDINLGTFNQGETLNGTCSMGMYSFAIKFN